MGCVTPWRRHLLWPPPQVDQEELETVVPQPGGSVLVLNGPHRGARGTLLSIDTKRFQASQQRAMDGPDREGG